MPAGSTATSTVPSTPAGMPAGRTACRTVSSTPDGLTVLLAPDKYKGSLSAAQVATHLGSGLRSRGVRVVELALADGGDGSVQAAVAAGFTAVPVTVAGATGREHTAMVAVRGTTAVVEVANTCGLHILPGGRLAPLAASTTGAGQALRQLVDHGTHRIVLALGGSASTDGGAGLLATLGLRFHDTTGRTVDVAGGTCTASPRSTRPACST